MSKYGNNILNQKTTKSFVYRGIQSSYPLFLSCTKTIVGNGKDCNLWTETWLNKPLRKTLIGPLPKDEDKRMVNYIISKTSNKNFTGNLKLFLSIAPPKLFWKLTLPLGQIDPQLNDHLSWKRTTNSQFNSISAYIFITKISASQHHNNSHLYAKNYKWIWKTVAHPQENFFLWQAYFKCLPVNTILFKVNSVQTDLCPLCSLLPKNHIHALRDCTTIANIWDSLNPPTFFN